LVILKLYGQIHPTWHMVLDSNVIYQSKMINIFIALFLLQTSEELLFIL